MSRSSARIVLAVAICVYSCVAAPAQTISFLPRRGNRSRLPPPVSITTPPSTWSSPPMSDREAGRAMWKYF